MIRFPRLSQRGTDAIRVVGAILAFALTLAALVMLSGCAALAGPLGLAVAGDISGAVSAAKAHSDAAIAEAQGRAQFWAAASGAIALASAVGARWIDHKLKKKA